MSRLDHMTRRGFLAAAGGIAAAGPLKLATPLFAQSPAVAPAGAAPSRVALVQGESRPAIIFDALKRIEADIRRGLAGKKRIIIKPNMVVTTNQLAATHADCIEGMLEYFSSLFKGEILIAESSANGPAGEGYDHYKYVAVADKYKARLVDLDHEPVVTEHIVNERYRPTPLRLCKMLMDPEAYVVSAAMLKTHDRAVVTLSLKNLVVGAIGKDPGFRWGKGSKGVSDKHLVHGGRKNEGIHYNLFSLARRLRPDLAVLDGFQGMEGNGPVNGTPVDHRVAVASTDWLAADRVGVELMGFDFAKVGYLTFCAKAGMGQADLEKLEILGEKVAQLARKYRPHDTIEQQYKWMEG
ncbi:MAG TPA: DUF362 domain-containing protein [Phycisphaerae bacterium]|jgi:uncharacterized protein (DUF362 family)|nr:DUF362 domain-containing protein [Phycisphaerae bacterium]HOB73517.1 DUF362 domain-containing protein [Phycisphaerae bacterium]HOJ54125.1 DUF362 domain-containing protein [Phycisphaerae bacterium]HOL25582.1 DUF362 domain-containing protein [Phycisphaerae bacterium]HPU31884.1 DUF362 domain-containing protein [Phycisphaerae bacterium]